MKTVLAAIDFSSAGEAVLTVARELARAIRGRIVLVHVVQPSIATELTPFAGEIPQLTDEIERDARRRLERLGKRLGARAASVQAICRQGFPVATILAHAKQEEADYIVVGSHGHTALYDLVVGSTTSGVLKRATCPVVVVPATPEKAKTRPPGRK